MGWAKYDEDIREVQEERRDWFNYGRTENYQYTGNCASSSLYGGTAKYGYTINSKRW